MTNEENKGAEFRVGQRVRRLATECQVEYTGTITRVIGSGEYGVKCDDGLRRTEPHAHLRHEPAEQKAPVSSHDWSKCVDVCLRCGITAQVYHQRGQPLCGGAEQKARFYGEMPKVLPRTLPAGVVLHPGYRSLVPSELKPNGYYCHSYERDGHVSGDHNSWFEPHKVDWKTVPIQEDPPPARASADLPFSQECGCVPGTAHGCEPPEPGRADPYAMAMPKEHERYVAQQMVEQDAKRLSAMTLRERRKSEALRMIDRPCEAKHPGHPRSWPEDSGEELRVS